MNKSSANLQDIFLNQLRKESIPATFYLINGFQLKGLVRGFDNFTIVLDSEGRQQMVYKHAVSTVSPLRAVSLKPEAVLAAETQTTVAGKQASSAETQAPVAEEQKSEA